MKFFMFTWTNEYSVGVQEMDEQHQQFLAIANETIELANKDYATKAELVALLSKFMNYVMYHLATEEEYFAKFGCPQPGHMEAHDAFRAKIENLFQKTREADPATHHFCVEAVARFAGQWLIEHIMIMDKRYTDCFNKHSLQ